MYLQKGNQKLAADFLNSALWHDIKRCLMARRPVAPDAKDEIHVAAAKGHERKGFEDTIAAMEKLPFEFDQEQHDPFKRPAVAIIKD